MKHIIAIIKAVMVDDVIIDLHKVDGFPGAILSEVRGAGKGIHQLERAEHPAPAFGYPNFIRLEIVCQAGQLEELISVIEKNAYTGNPGDGKIFVCDMEQAVRISTGQRGVDAV